MRAGLFLEGLSRSYDVRVLVVPVFGGASPPEALVSRCALQFEVLELEANPKPLADLKQRMSTKSSRVRALELGPRPTLCRSATIGAAARVAEAAKRCTVVHVMRLYLLPFLDALLDAGARPSLLVDVDDLESEARAGPAAVNGSESARYRRLERHYLPLLDGAIACSRLDARLLHERGARRVAVVPNAVRIPDGHGDDGLRAGDQTATDLLFVGNLSYAPNIQGACWLVECVLPFLEETVRLTLVGSCPSSAVRRLSNPPRVRVHADVPSVAPFYAGASVAVAPLHSGGGTSIKVIEALAHARPVVSTRIGARGLGEKFTSDVTGHRPVQVADRPEAFAAACCRLVDEPRLARALGRLGRSLVEESLTIDRVAEQIDLEVKHMVGGQ